MAKQPPVKELTDLARFGPDRQFARTLGRGLEVLRAFRADDPALTSREICRRTGLAKATVSRLTYTLMLLGYLVPMARNAGFRLGPGVLSISHPLLAQLRVRQVIRPHMEELARLGRCTVNLGMRDRLAVIYVDSCRADRVVSENPDIGSTRPLLTTAIGRALILSMPKSEQTAILNRLRLQNAADFARGRGALASDAERLKAAGHCFSRGDWVEEIHAAAVPIHRSPDGISLAMNCTLWVKKPSDRRVEHELVPMLIRSAQQISAALEA